MWELWISAEGCREEEDGIQESKGRAIEFSNSLSSHMVKNLPANAGDLRGTGSTLCWEDLLEEGMATTPVFLPGELNRQRSLEGSIA